MQRIKSGGGEGGGVFEGEKKSAVKVLTSVVLVCQQIMKQAFWGEDEKRADEAMEEENRLGSLVGNESFPNSFIFWVY